MTDNRGEPAFPSSFIHPSNRGMTLRDWFAGQALAGIMEWRLSTRPPNEREASEQAYAYADAMLAARTSRKEGEE